MGMLVKSEELVPSCEDEMVDKEQTLAALRAKGFPSGIATATTDDNFKGRVCPAPGPATCPDHIDPFEMNTITRDRGVTSSPVGQPHEHFRSTGICERSPSRFGDAELRCVELAVPFLGVWDFGAITCMANFWDLDPGCRGASSNDVDRNKRPARCCDNVAPDKPCCDSAAKNRTVPLPAAWHDRAPV